MNKDELLKLARSKSFLVVASSALSLLAGASAGYVVASKKLEKAYAEISEREIAEAKEYYKRHYMAEEFASPVDAAKALLEPDQVKALREFTEAHVALSTYQGKPAPDYDDLEETKSDEPETHNVFDEAEDQPDFDYEAELAQRDPSKPYVITHAEFLENDVEYIQSSITWYEGDSTLADEQDEHIPDPDKVVGEDSLYKFGYGSDDEMVVYVRNERMERDFEITKSHGKYAHEVLGLQHSDDTRMRIRKFRGDDE